MRRQRQPGSPCGASKHPHGAGPRCAQPWPFPWDGRPHPGASRATYPLTPPPVHAAGTPRRSEAGPAPQQSGAQRAYGPAKTLPTPPIAPSPHRSHSGETPRGRDAPPTAEPPHERGRGYKRSWPALAPDAEYRLNPVPLSPPRGSTPPPMHIFCQICGGPAPPEVGAAECDTCHGKIQAAGAQKRRAFCASRPDLGPDFLPQMDAHVAVVTRRAVLASRPTVPHRRASSAKATPVRVGPGPGPPLVRVPSDGSRSFELYEEEHNALNCTLADNVGELNPPMEAYTKTAYGSWRASGVTRARHPRRSTRRQASTWQLRTFPSLPPSPPSSHGTIRLPCTATWLRSPSAPRPYGARPRPSRQRRCYARHPPTASRCRGNAPRVMERAADAGLRRRSLHARSDIVRGQPSAFELTVTARAPRGDLARRPRVRRPRPPPVRPLPLGEMARRRPPAAWPSCPSTGRGHPGRAEAERYNAETFELFAASCLRGGSLRQGHIGQPLETDTVAGYVSALRALPFPRRRDPDAFRAHTTFAPRPSCAACAGRAGLGPLAESASACAPATCKRRRPTARGFDRKRSWAARRRWLAAVVCHSLVARGCELGRTDEQSFLRDPAGLAMAQRRVARRRLAAPHPRRPHGASVRREGRRGHGPALPDADPCGARAGNSAPTTRLCAYDLLSAAWREDVRSLLASRRRSTRPSFATSARGGAAIGIRDVATCARSCARSRLRRARTPAAFGAHSLRIGGASDFRDLFDTSTAAGLEEAKRALKARGRWQSDIAYIYARTSLDSVLEASARVAERLRPRHRVSVCRVGRARCVSARLARPQRVGRDSV